MLARFELPVQFVERYRPVKAQPRERGAPLYLFDDCGLRFYRQMTTAGGVPVDAVWSVIPEGACMQLAHGIVDEALGYVVAQSSPREGDPTSYRLPIRLGYRAKVAVHALQQLRDQFLRSEGLARTADAIAVIDRQIDAYHYPRAKGRS